MGDYTQYVCLKHALLSGINQIDTGFSFRMHRAERVVGAVIRTL
jgi:aryl-alcohol dehydrogenase-like predicted oxidoreductase